jgi:hypothetical protein
LTADRTLLLTREGVRRVDVAHDEPAVAPRQRAPASEPGGP